MQVLVVMLASCALYGLPGALLYPLLRERGYGLAPSLGIGMALLTVLYSTLASIVGYIAWLQLSATLLLDALLLVVVCQRRTLLSSGFRFRLSDVERWKFLLLSLIALVYLIPAYLVPVPFDTDGQGFGLLIATVRSSGSITTLAPFYPEISWLYSPGYFLLGALLSDVTGAGIHEVMLGLSHLLSLGVIAGVGALGQLLGGHGISRRFTSSLGWWAAAATAGGVALFTTLMDSAYTNIYGLWLTTTFLFSLGHTLARKSRLNNVIAGLSLASVLLAHPDSIIHLLSAYSLFYVTSLFARPKITVQQYTRMAVSVPILGIIFSFPWIFRILHLVSQIDVHERQFPHFNHLVWLIKINGFWIPILAMFGLYWAIRRRHWLDVWSVTWLLSIVEFSSLGNLDRLSRRISLDPLQVLYPLGVAWHATVIPLPLLAVRALHPFGSWCARTLRWERILEVFMVLLVVMFGTIVIFREPIIMWSKSVVRPIVGSVVSEADISAYLWLKSNTPKDARLLNYPGRYEGQWAPVIAERQSVFFRDQLFYIGAKALRENQASMVDAYLNPNSKSAYDVIRWNAIDYIVVPQSLSRPDLIDKQLRWKQPDLLAQRSWFSDTPYLSLVVDFDGAQVWQVQDIGSWTEES